MIGYQKQYLIRYRRQVAILTGDDTDQCWHGPYNSGDNYSREHTWNQQGNYNIKVKARDNHWGISEWSDPFPIVIQQNDDSNPEPTCFLAGTKITMADGSCRNIVDVCVGDYVVSYDINNNTKTTGRVTKVCHHTPHEMTDYYLIINGNLRVTPNHLFLVDGRWIEAGKITPGDSLFRVDQKACSLISISSVDMIFKQVETYNLEVDGCGTYMASGVVVNSYKMAYVHQVNNNALL